MKATFAKLSKRLLMKCKQKKQNKAKWPPESVLLVQLAFTCLCPGVNLLWLRISVNLSELKINWVDDIADGRQDGGISDLRSSSGASL